MISVENIRDNFPILSQKVYGKSLIYLDNAATSQRPLSVIDFQESFSRECNANVHRAVHSLSGIATDLYESGREAVRSFLDAEYKEEIIFTSGTTASINLMAHSFVEAFCDREDVIVISQAEHHSNIVPWQMAALRTGIEVKVAPINRDGSIDLEELREILKDKRVKLLSITHISNVLGVVNPIQEIVKIAHNQGVKVLVDGAQGVVHSPISVRETDVDFYAFSGHKIYAPTGIGVLYGKRELLDIMPPFMGGGDMVDTVTFEKTTYAPLPLKFEAGTQNIAAVASLKPALEFAMQISDNDEFANRERQIVEYVTKELNAIEGLTILGTATPKIPLFSFVIDGVHHEDVAQILDKMGVAVRSGLVCAEPLINSYGYTGIIRASFAPYNTLEEAQIFIKSLHRAISMLK